jgi:Cof subfamily protein (haloacid dehalogenase superfamily)
MIKLIAVDLDGTLFNTESKISLKNRQSLKKCLDRGIKVVITTAKTVYWVRKLIVDLDLKDPQIASAGAAVIDAGINPLFVKKIPAYCYRQMVELAREHGVGICASCIDGYVYHENHNPSLEHVWETGERPRFAENLLDNEILSQALLVTITVDEGHAFNWEFKSKFEEKIKIRRGGPYFLAAYNKKTGKAAALKKILAALSISAEDVMAVGDSESDLGMIRLAGCGVAMGNASVPVKEAADFVVSGNDSDGVSEAIERFVFGENPDK